MEKVIVIGSGIAGLSAACHLGQAGFDVTVLEKNATPGGRARQFEAGGFVFDMGPSWYWMPDVFEKFFHQFGARTSDHYKLKRLDPSYRVYYSQGDFMDLPAGIRPLSDLFEKIETGGAEALRKFLDEAGTRYAISMNELVYKHRLTWRDICDLKLLKSAWRLNLLTSHSSYIRKFFKNPRLLSVLQFPALFLGAPSRKIPSMYSLMNFADMALGTWYPMGGIYAIVKAMVKIAEGYGVTFRYNQAVTDIVVRRKIATAVITANDSHEADYIVASADYRHVEKDLVPEDARQYTDSYWQKRTLAPSSLIFYLGLNKRINNLLHHTLFFDEDIGRHLHEIYQRPQWPVAPQFYVCCSSKTDPSVAPPGCENLFILIPVAAGLKDEDSIREKYFRMVLGRIERLTGENIRAHIVFKKSYAHNDFIADYNAFKGNAYGLANILLQTANFRPRMVNKHIRNVFFTGQFTVPGPGVPPALISGKVAADALRKCSVNGVR